MTIKQKKQLIEANNWINKAMIENKKSKIGLYLIYADDCISAVLDNKSSLLDDNMECEECGELYKRLEEYCPECNNFRR